MSSKKSFWKAVWEAIVYFFKGVAVTKPKDDPTDPSKPPPSPPGP